MAFTAGMTCPNCGARLDSDSVFCTECGTNISTVGVAAASGGAGRCAGCNAPLDDDAMFCTECGTPVAATAGTTMPMAASGSTCPACGAPVDDDAAFCAGCGAPVSPSASTGNCGGLTCTVCGEPLDEDTSFCVICGTKVGAGGAVPVTAPMTTPTVTPLAPVAAMPTEPPRIFEGNYDDSEAEGEMRRHFHSAEGFSE